MKIISELGLNVICDRETETFYRVDTIYCFRRWKKVSEGNGSREDTHIHTILMGLNVRQAQEQGTSLTTPTTKDYNAILQVKEIPGRSNERTTSNLLKSWKNCYKQQQLVEMVGASVTNICKILPDGLGITKDGDAQYAHKSAKTTAP